MIRRTEAWAAMGCIVLLVLWPFVAHSGSSLAGQSGPDRFRVEVGAMVRGYDNFFLVPAGGNKRTLLAWTTDAQAFFRPSVSPVVEIHGGGEFTRYGSVGDSPGVIAGLMYWSRTHVLRLDARYTQDRPIFTLGDVTRFARLGSLSGFYSFRPGTNWRFDLSGRADDVVFDALPQANSRFYIVGGAIRYRTFPYFQPELGGRVGWRDAVDPDQDNSGGRVSVGVVSEPANPLVMNVRYRFRSRWYTVSDAAAGNFGRSDEGDQWTFVSLLRASDHLRLRLIYDRMDMDSTLARRIYSSQSVALGATVVF